ncbi:MAG TPA: hypothetical protein VM491_09545 [Burkholderiaceae bacterium]|nr:hypothetical protein [Burkholderiaceae bacterium]
MTVKGFIFLLIVTVVAIGIGSAIAERFTGRGLERTLAVAVITAAIVFPAAWIAEKLGWIQGGLRLNRRKDSEATREEDRK